MHPETLGDTATRSLTPLDRLASGAQEDHSAPVLTPVRRPYRPHVVADPKVRLARFTDFVRRAIRDSGKSVEDLAREAGIGTNTLYLWRNGTAWKEFPQGETVRKFCLAAGRSSIEALSILWPAEGDKPAEPEPLDIPPEFRTVLRMLRSDTVPDEVKDTIVAVIRGLAGQSNLNTGGGAGENRDVS